MHAGSQYTSQDIQYSGMKITKHCLDEWASTSSGTATGTEAMYGGGREYRGQLNHYVVKMTYMYINMVCSTKNTNSS